MDGETVLYMQLKTYCMREKNVLREKYVTSSKVEFFFTTSHKSRVLDLEETF